jgi:hypothetical protein
MNNREKIFETFYKEIQEKPNLFNILEQTISIDYLHDLISSNLDYMSKKEISDLVKILQKETKND